MTQSKSIRSLAAMLAAIVLAGSACGKSTSAAKMPAPGSVDADKFLFDRGTELLAKKNWLSARQYFEKLVEIYPGSPYRQNAKLAIGDTYLGEGRVDSLILATNQFREFLQYFPLNPRADYAQFKVCQAASRQMLSPQRDQTGTRDAIRECELFTRNYPASSLRAEGERLRRAARDRLSQNEFEIGLLYFRGRIWAGAMGRFTSILADDPDYSGRDGVFFYMAEILFRNGNAAEALPYYTKVVTEFPKSDLLKKAQARMDEIKRGGAKKT